MADGGKEFSVLNEDANIYKLIGPVLVKQDRAEAVMNVDKRLEFIEAEMYVHLPSLDVSSGPLTCVCRNRTEAQLRSIQEKQERKKMEIMQLQSGPQIQAGPAQ